jgi:hypothetical protein
MSDLQCSLPTKDELDDRLRQLGLSDADIDFIYCKFFFEIGHGDLHHDDRAVELFVARLLNHPEYAGKIRAMAQPAFLNCFAQYRPGEEPSLNARPLNRFCGRPSLL